MTIIMQMIPFHHEDQLYMYCDNAINLFQDFTTKGQLLQNIMKYLHVALPKVKLLLVIL